MRLFTIFFFSLLLFGCENAPKTAESILEKSINHHDPNGQWNSFKGQLHIESNSVYSGWKTENLEVEMDIPSNTFTYFNNQRNVEVSFEGDSCLATEEICDGYSWTKNFYTYIWGLPMKLHDEGTPLEEEFEVGIFNQRPCYILKANYPDDNWLYYIDKTTHALIGFQFTKGKNTERVYLSKEKHVEGMLLPSVRKWMEVHEDGSEKKLGDDLLVKAIAY